MSTLRSASVLLLAVALRPGAHAQPPLSFPPVQTFADVGFSARWYGTTDLLRERNITTGCQAYPQALYCPDWNADRAMISILIIRSIYSALTGNPEGFSHPTSPYFQDVDSGHWAFKYVQQMKALGITAGCGDGTGFCPNDPATNYMAAVFAVRARYVRDNGGAAVPPGWLPPYATDPQRFWDVSFGDPIFPWVQRAYDLVGPEIHRPEFYGYFYRELAIPRGPLSFYLIYGILGSQALPPNYQGGTPAYSIAPVTNGPACGLTAGPFYFNLVAQLNSDSYLSTSATVIDAGDPSLWVSGARTVVQRNGMSVWDSSEFRGQDIAYIGILNPLTAGNYLQLSSHRVASGACNVAHPPGTHQSTVWPASGQPVYMPAPPLAVSCAASPNPAIVGQLVTFSAAVSGGAPPYSYFWSGVASSGQATASYIPGSAGTFYETVEVWDVVYQGATAYCTSTVTSGAPVTTITTNPPGLHIVVYEGETPHLYTAPQSFQWTPGSEHSIAVATFQGSGAWRHVFSNWSNGGSARQKIIAPSSSTTYTANFTYTATTATLDGPAPTWLEAGLSYMPFDIYDDGHLAASFGFPYSCPAGSTVRGCFKTVLRELRAQGVTGVRIYFDFCGGSYSTPLSGCGNPWHQVTGPNANWVANVGEFFRDMSDADIQNVTITPVHHSSAQMVSRPRDQTTNPSGPTCALTPDTVWFDRASPFGRERMVFPDGIEYRPIGQNDNEARNCAPINPYFIGWQNQYNVIEAMLNKAKTTPATPSGRRFTVFELDFEQELDLTAFPVLSRFIWDNAHADSDPAAQGRILDALRYYMGQSYMGQSGFDPDRVTWSVVSDRAWEPAANCNSVYGRPARLIKVDALAMFLQGGKYGWPPLPSVSAGLVCGGNLSDMPSSEYYGPQPGIIDLHHRPGVESGGVVSLVQSEATIDFNNVRNYLNLPHVPSTTIVMLGESWSNTFPTPCEGGPANAAADTIPGYNASTLKTAGRNIVFRPWMQLSGPSGECFTYPNNQRVNFLWGGPYAPSQFERRIAPTRQEATVKSTRSVVLSFLLAALQAPGQAAALRGSVTTEDGKPLPGAVVLYQRIPQLTRNGRSYQIARGEAVVSRAASSDASGAFAALDLPGGDYLICAGVPATAYLDPCKWSTSPKVTLSSGVAGTVALVLKKGVFLRVRVTDPLGLLPLNVGPMSAGNLIIGVRFGKGAFHAAEAKRVDRTGRDYELAIPAGMPMSLWVFSRHVTLTDARGSPVDNQGAMLPFQASAGQDQTFTLSVSGRVPGAK